MRPQYCLAFLIIVALPLYYINEFMASVVEMEYDDENAVVSLGEEVSMGEVSALQSGLDTVEQRLEALELTFQRFADSKVIDRKSSHITHTTDATLQITESPSIGSHVDALKATNSTLAALVLSFNNRRFYNNSIPMGVPALVVSGPPKTGTWTLSM